MFEAKTYQERRKKLKETLGSGILLFMGNEESPMNYLDNVYHFRQDSSFLYFWGMDFPSLAAVIDIDEDKEILFGDELSIDMIVWMGTQPTLKERAGKAGIREVSPASSLAEFLRKNKNRKIHFLPPYRPENKIKLHRLLDLPIEKIEENKSVDFIKAVVAQREIKSEEEIKELDKAASISADMHIAAMQMARPGMKESEVAARMQQVAVSSGGQLSFPIICTINGQTLHNHYHGNTIGENDLLLIDAGAETDTHYAGDLSHTFPINKKFTQKQKEIYQIALDAHNAAVDILRPGIRMLDVHFTAARTIANGMKNLGLMKGDIDEAVQLGAHALFFQCGTGHMMGLDVHDMEDLGEQFVGYDEVLKKETKLFGLKSLRLGKELKTGFVLTIEPGIYFIPELIDMWKAEKRFSDFINYGRVEEYKNWGGCRSEEDFVITGEGKRLLGKDVPKTIEAVEEIRSNI